MPKVNLDEIVVDENASPSSVIPAGEYPVQVLDCVEKEGKNAPYFSIEFKVIQEGAYFGRRVWEIVSFSEKCLPRVKKLCQATGIGRKGSLNLDALDLLNAKLNIVVNIEEDEYQGKKRKKNRVEFLGFKDLDMNPQSETQDDDTDFDKVPF